MPCVAHLDGLLEDTIEYSFLADEATHMDSAATEDILRKSRQRQP